MIMSNYRRFAASAPMLTSTLTNGVWSF